MIPFYSCKENTFDYHEKPKYEVKKLGDGLYSLQLSGLGLEDLPAQIKTKIKLSNVIQLNIDFSDIEILPQDFFVELTNIQILSAAGNSFRSFDVSNLKNLERLNLDYNIFSHFPENILNLKKLKTITLRNNFITNIPSAFGDLIELEDLSLYGNELTQLPLSFGNLTKLANLDLSFNRLKELPQNFGNLTSLQMLRMCHNCLTQLPKSFENLPQIQTLDVSENLLISLPSNFKSSQTLRKFCGDENKLTSLPPWFNDCFNLIDISVKNNLLQGQLSDNFGIHNLKLNNIDFSGNKLNGSIPIPLCCHKNLKIIDFGSSVCNSDGQIQKQTNIIYLPSVFGQNLTHLTQLRLDHCQINELPEGFGYDLNNLESLNLDKNNLTKLPDSFCMAKKLVFCILSSNKLKFLPQNFGNLTKLVELRLEHNLMYILPPTFIQLVTLKSLNLYDNRFKSFPGSLRSLPLLECLGIEIDLTTMIVDFMEIRPEIARMSQAILMGNERWKHPIYPISNLKASINSRYLFSSRRRNRNILNKQVRKVSLNPDLWDNSVDDNLNLDNPPINDSFKLPSSISCEHIIPKSLTMTLELMPHLPQKSYPRKLRLKCDKNITIEDQFEEDL